MKNKYIYLVLSSLIGIVQFAFSQELHFRRYGIKEGLVHSGTGSREVIIQDREGFLWFSTHHGVSRFDGIEFKNFKYESDNPNSIGDNFTTGIVEADDGKIWMGTADHGMYIFDPTTESFTQLEEELTEVCGHGMNTLNKDQEGNIWIGTRFDGFCKWVKKTGQFENVGNLTDGHHFYQQKNGTIWLGEQKGLYKMLPDGKFRYMPMPGVSENWRYRQVHDVGEVENETFLLTTSYEGFWSFDLDQETFTDARQLFPLKNSKVPYSFHTDENDNIWIGGNGELWQWNPKDGAKKIYRYDKRNPYSVPNSTIHCITKDKAGSIWLITRDGGMAVAHDSEHPFEIITPMPVSKVFPVDEKNTLVWKNRELFVYNHELKKLMKSDIPVGLMKDGRASISNYSTEEILIYEGNRSIPKLYNKQTKKVKLLPEAYYNSRIAGGRIWDGLFYLNTQKDEWIYAFPEFQKNIPNFIPSISVFKEIAHDIDSSIWIATAQGLFNYNLETKQSKHYTHDPNEPNSLSTNICQFIFEGSNRRMYMTTTNGLSIYDPQKDHFDHYTTKNGLLHDHVHTIVEDAEGNPWIGSAIGLQKLDLKTGEFSSYGVYDGLPNEFIHGGKSFRDPAGYLYFISMNEAFRFHPDSLPVRDYSAPVYLMDFFLERELVQVGAADSLLQKMIRYTPELNLTYEQNDFGFSFSMPVFYKAEETEYFYRLAPYQKEWQTAGKERQIHYTNIDEGKYTFEVKAKTVSGVWSTKTASIAIMISPPWYRTWWAYTTYFLLFSGLLLLFFRYYRNRLLLQQQLVFEQQEAQRLKELDGFKTRLFTNITHEFRTPLTVIMGMTDNIEGHQNEKNLISKNSKNLLHLVNELLDLSKLEAGEMKLHNIHTDIIPYLKYLTESFHSMAKEQQIDLRFQSDSEELFMDFDESKIQHMVYNLLSNALKFSNVEDQVVLQVTKEEQDNTQYLQLKVSDTGVGIKEKDLAHLFDRFYQADATSTRKGEGTGIGLALTKELVELMDGEISVKSKFGEGTDFTILLPIKRESSVSALEQGAFPKPQTPVATSIEFPSQENPSSEKPQLLIIEDNQDITIYISTLLGSDYQIFTAQNGQEGINKAIEIVPDIIISDVMMPEKNGYEVCKILKQDERSSHIPIILLTAKATQEAKVEGLKYGADAYLTKPFHKEELLVRLEQLVALRKQLQAKYVAQQTTETSKAKLLPPIENAFLQKLNAAIISHLDDTDFSVAQLAQIMLLSQVQLYRKVKALTGKNTMLYIRSLRLKKAKELLLNSDLNISEIAYEVGFSDPNYFSRVFQQEFNHPPTSFRK